MGSLWGHLGVILGSLGRRGRTKTQKTHHARAPLWAAPGQLGRPWESLWEALEELWEALYIGKLPINRPSGRYVTYV